MTGGSSMQRRALALVGQGIPVIPCRCIDKRPLTDNGFKDASNDHAVICQWWTRWPRAYVGVPTGHRFVVVDIDLQHSEARDWLEANRARLPQTRAHITKSGGRHLFFRPHGGIACSAGRLGPHVDTRGLGGYVIWWPACGFEVLHREVIAPVPEWIVTALYRATPAPVLAVPVIKGASNTVVAAKLAGIISRAASAQEGERNSVTFWCACRLAEMVRDRMIGRGEAMALLIEAAARTGLSQREILRTASSAFRGAST